MKTGDKLRTEFKQLYGPYFSYREAVCKCSHCEDIRAQGRDLGEWFRKPEFMAFMYKLIGLRTELGFPFPMNSLYRCPDHNDSIYIALGRTPGTHLEGPHTKGAGDIAIFRERMCALVNLATTRQLGIGIKQHGPLEKRLIHIDNLGFRIWTYP